MLATWPATLTLGLALILAGIDWTTVARNQRRFEYIFKPATLVAVLVAAWLVTRGPHDAWQARWFLPGLFFSLAGDVFLMLPDQHFFLPGLVSFLTAHLCYIVGLNSSLPPVASLVLLVVVGAISVMLFRGIARGLGASKQTSLLGPVAVYTLVISLMLFSAWATWLRPEWGLVRRVLVSAGATLFYASDSLLAWDRFVSPSASARLKVMITYHLGQLLLAASIAQTI